MDRRAFLWTIGAALIPKIIRVTPPKFYLWNPHPAQLKFLNTTVEIRDWVPPNQILYVHQTVKTYLDNLYGTDTFSPDKPVGGLTYLDIERSTEPIKWRR